MSTYSIYVFLDEKNRPYYVGKTNNFKRRKKEHEAEIKKGNKLPKYNKARKLIKQGTDLKMRTIRKVDKEDEAYKLERYYIKKYRKEGYVLLNCTSGGPLEKPIRINRPKIIKEKGILLPVKVKDSSPIKAKLKKFKTLKKQLRGGKKRNGTQYRSK